MASSIRRTNQPEDSMNNAKRIAEQYVETWNERDTASRRAKVENLFTLDASYLDPMMRGSGHSGLDAMIAAAQQQFPGHHFTLAGAPDGHNDVVRFSWTLCGLDGAQVARGTDVGVVGSDGRLARVTGFLDQHGQ
jgi:hypothetical protein